MRGSILGLGSLVTFVVACGGGAPRAVTATPQLSSSPPQATNVSAPPEQKASDTAPPPAPLAEPTVLTEAQKKRDDALSPKIATFIDAFSNVDAELTKDRKKVLFRSNREGLWQAYMGDVTKPAAAPTRLTSGNERVTFARLTADERYIVFASDQGADENFRLFRMNLDGTGLTNLTPNEKLHRDPPVFPRNRPTEMVYSARDNASPSTSVFVQVIKEGAPRKVYTDAEPAFVVDVSPDGSRALLLRYRSQSEQVLFGVDLDSGKATRLFPQSERKTVRITSARHSADGKRVYLSTDDGTDGSFVVRIDGSGVISARYKEESPATAQIADIEVSPKDDRIAIAVDAGDRTETRVLDDMLKPVATVKSPLGTIAVGQFAADGKSFTAFLATPDKPGDLFDVDAATGAMKPLRTDLRPGFATLPKVDVSIVLAQASDGLSIPINLYLPSGKKDKLPVMVSVHGGPAASSRIGWNPSALFWTSQGYAFVEPNIRGSTGFGRTYELGDNKERREAALKDIASVNAWARDQAWCDDDRIVISGGSYGGYMTLMALSRQPSIWRAGVDLVGISDLRTFFRSTSGTIRSILIDEFGDPEKDAALLAQYSPITQVDKITAPLFVYQGQNDPRVPRAEADAIVTALRSRKVPVEYMVAPNEGHSLDRRENKIEFLARVARFLDETMPKTTAPMPVAKN